MPFVDPVMSVAFALVSMIWTWWIARSVHQHADVDRGQSVVRYSPGIRAISPVAWLGAVVATVIAVVEPLFPIWCRIVICASAWFLAAVLHTELAHAEVRFDQLGVHVLSPWRTDRFVPWDDFQRVYFSDMNDSYVLESTDSGKISLHRYMSGIDSLLAELAKHDVTMEDVGD